MYGSPPTMPAAVARICSATVRTVTGPALRASRTKPRTSLSVRLSRTTLTTTVLAVGSTYQSLTPDGASSRSMRDTVSSSRRELCSTVRTVAPVDCTFRTVESSAPEVIATVSLPLSSSNHEPP